MKCPFVLYETHAETKFPLKKINSIQETKQTALVTRKGSIPLLVESVNHSFLMTCPYLFITHSIPKKYEFHKRGVVDYDFFANYRYPNLPQPCYFPVFI